MALIGAGKNAVHVQIEQGHAAGDAVDAQRVHSGVEVHCAVQALRMGVQAAGQFPDDVLAFQFISMHAGHNADALAPILPGGRRNAIFSDLQCLLHRQLKRNNGLFHERSSSF